MGLDEAPRSRNGSTEMKMIVQGGTGSRGDLETGFSYGLVRQIPESAVTSCPRHLSRRGRRCSRGWQNVRRRDRSGRLDCGYNAAFHRCDDRCEADVGDLGPGCCFKLAAFWPSYVRGT